MRQSQGPLATELTLHQRGLINLKKDNTTLTVFSQTFLEHLQQLYIAKRDTENTDEWVSPQTTTTLA